MKQRSCGFTLVEVMVALFVLALTFIGVIGSASHVSRSLTVLEEKTLALWVVQNAMSEMLLGLPAPTQITLGKRTWYCTVSTVPESSYDRVTLHVSTERRGGNGVEKVFYVAQ